MLALADSGAGIKGPGREESQVFSSKASDNSSCCIKVDKIGQKGPFFS